MVTEILNHMSRTELTSTLETLTVASPEARSLQALLASPPLASGIEPGRDVFAIDLPAALIEDISFAVAEFSYDRAERYAKAVEEGTNTAADDTAWQYWQALSEKWGYLEVMC